MTNEDIKKLKRFKYNIGDINVIIPGDSTKYVIRSRDIIQIRIIKNYDDSFFPILLLDCGIETDLYKKMETHKGNVKYKIKLEKTDIDLTDTSMMYNFSNVVFDEVFSDYDEELKPDSMNNLMEKSQLSDDEVNKVSMEREVRTIPLFIDAHLKSHRNIPNGIIVSMTIIEAIIYTMNTCGVSKYLVTPPDNRGGISDFLFPHKGLKPTILNIENVYGIYNKGFRMFWDYDYLYLMDRQPHSRAYIENEIETTIIYFQKPDNVKLYHYGCATIDKIYKINSSEQPTFRFNEKFSSQIAFTDINGIVPSAGSSSTAGTSNQFCSHNKIVENKYGNSYHINSIAYANKEMNLVASLPLSDVDVEMIRPNKQIKFQFSEESVNKQFNGEWRISACEYLFINKENYFDLNAVLTLKKKV